MQVWLKQHIHEGAMAKWTAMPNPANIGVGPPSDMSSAKDINLGLTKTTYQDFTLILKAIL